MQAGRRIEAENAMRHYIALIHKDADSCYGVSFPDWPGVFTAGNTIDDAMQQAAEVLEFAAEDWQNPDGSRSIPPPRTIDELRADTEFQSDAAEAIIAAVPFRAKAEAAE
jgi:predicted RNase H-like HicB family nuclease